MKNNGQTLIELLIAIALFAILIPALMTGFAVSRSGRAQQGQRLQATAYIKEAEEAVRVIKSNGWSNVINGTFYPVVSGSTWALATGSEVISGNLTRKMVISDVERDVNGNMVESGGVIDTSTKKIVISVSWLNPIPANVTSTMYLSRNNNSIYVETTSTDFNKGVMTSTQVTNLSGGEVKLANNNKAKWCSPALSPVTIDLPDGPPVAVAAFANATNAAIPNEVFVAVAPYATSSTKLAYVNVTANTENPVATIKGTFTLDSTKYSSAGLVPTGIGIDNNFKTNDVKYYTSPAGKVYALLATDLPTKEVLAIQINNGVSDTFQDPVNKIYKYHTFFNTKIYDTAYNNPSANSSETANAGDNDGYQTNPANAYASDGAFAVDTNSGNNTGTLCSGNDKDKHRFYNYGFGVPSGATIDGIELNLIAKADSTTGTPKICVQLSWDGGTTWTTAKTTNNLTTSNVAYVLGGSSDTWGRTWSDSDFSNTNFRVRLIDVASNTSRDFSLDSIGMKIHYNGTSTSANDQTPFDYGVRSMTVLGNRGYVAAGGFLYTFDLSNIDSKSPSNGLDQIGCRIELDGYDCKPGATASDKKYDPGESGTSWSNIGSPAHNDCSDGGNIELNADGHITGVSVAGNNYIYVAVGAGTDKEFNIVNATSVPTSGTNPSISSPSCGTTASGNAGWKVGGSLDFNSLSGTEEAANSVYAKSDGTRAYISSNGGIDANNDGKPDSYQLYVVDTTSKTAPKFLSANADGTAKTGFYNGAGANGEMYPRRSLTVLNGERLVLVGKDGISNGNNALEYQVLDNTTEATPTYCSGINYDQGFNDLTSVSEADSDNYVYMVANTALNELKIIQGGPDNALYVSSGTFESQIYNAGTAMMGNRFFATANVPLLTTIKYQVAIEPQISGSCTGVTYTYVGPDGTPLTYFNTPSELPRSSDGIGYENAGQCMRYKVFMTSSDQLQTPTLSDIGFSLSP